MECALVLVGAGPCALAVLGRLAYAADGRCGTSPAEAARARELLRSTLVVSSAGWMGGWQAKLASQGVAWLRSPTFVNPHPARPIDDALLAFATARRAPLRRIRGVRHAWVAVAPPLLDDFCEGLLLELERRLPASTLPSRQQLTAAAVYHATVLQIRPREGRFELILADGCPPLTAARVVVATADGGVRALPEWFADAQRSARVPHSLLHSTDLAALHAACGKPPPLAPRRAAVSRAAGWHLATRAARLLRRGLACVEDALAGRPWVSRVLAAMPSALAAPDAMAARGEGRLVVVGGGLSAAQLAIRALKLGWRHVLLVSRGALVVRPFDLHACWLERHWQPALLADEEEFFRSAYERRRALLHAARPGGSVTPCCWEELGRLARRGGLRVEEHTCVTRAEWREGATERSPLQGRSAGYACWHLKLTHAAGRETSARADTIWLATGNRLDVTAQPLLRSVRECSSAREHGGLPELTPSLRWEDGMKLYIAGALSALQIGPDALTLGGAGLCAARIVSDILQEEP
ncbi:hypothetical protein AB1Y20_005793 [Prymnesium parvum]|uniref:L-ornithine N(5)-monooxygenase n=1 Tax=Prymnesium parvum TaxID=97485 RepID=A0AB34J2S3_PRYPA